MTKKNFMQGAFILFLSGTFVKIIGFAYHIIIIRIIGTEAVGLFNMVFPLYIMALVLSTAGLPLAVSKMVAHQMAVNNIRGSLKIFRISLALLLFLGIFISILLFLIAPWVLKQLYADPRVNWIFYSMLPCIVVVAVSSAFRGLFQGLQQMTPPALTQCIEQITRIIIGLFLVTKLQSYGIKAIAVGLAGSMLAGELVGLLFITVIYFRNMGKYRVQGAQALAETQNLPTRKVISDLFSFGVPTTFTRLMASLSLTLEASLIPLTLQKIGYTINQAASIYGQFSGVALTILTIPTVLTFSLATSLVPAISEADAQGKVSSLKFRSTESLRLTYLLGLPATIVLLLKSTGLATLLFNMPEAGPTLRILSFGAIFLYLCQTSNGILQGLGQVRRVFINTMVGTVIKILGIIFFVSIPELNIKGAAISFAISYIVVCFLNLQVIHQHTGFQLEGRQLFLPFLAGLLMAASMLIITHVLTPLCTFNQVTLISILISGLLYMFLITIWGQLDLIKKAKG